MNIAAQLFFFITSDMIQIQYVKINFLLPALSYQFVLKLKNKNLFSPDDFEYLHITLI